MEGQHEQLAAAEHSTGWQTAIGLAVALAVLAVTLYAAAAPLWREFVSEPRALADARAKEDIRIQTETDAANAWLKKKEEVFNEVAASFEKEASAVTSSEKPPAAVISSEKSPAAKRAVDLQQQREEEERKKREAEAIDAAIRAVEQSSDRMALPVKRSTKRKSAKGAKDKSAGANNENVDDYDAQLERATRQQAQRERTQLSTAFDALRKQLEGDNPGSELRASREEFGQLVKQIEELLDVRHTAAELDEHFAEYAQDGRIDLREFLRRESTIDWFQSDAVKKGQQERGSGKQLGSNKSMATGTAVQSSVQDVD